MMFAAIDESIRPEDSISQSGKSSTVSSISSSAIRAKAKKAALLAQKESIVKLQELSKKQLEIEQESERTKLDAQIKAVEAEENVLSQFDSKSWVTKSQVLATPDAQRTPLNPFAPPWTSTGVKNQTKESKFEIGASFMEECRPTYMQHGEANPFLQDMSVGRATCIPPVQEYSFHKVHEKSSNPFDESYQDLDKCKPLKQSDNNDYGEKFIELQRTMLDMLHMPKAEIVTFDGNPLMFWTFMRSFESCVDQSNMSESGKLSRLLQFCTGKAREVINCCAIMEPYIGYYEAKRLLYERFGNKYTIAKSWIVKITEGSNIKPNDGAALRQFADDVKSCVLTLTAMGRQGEIDNQIRMVQIIEKLPYYLQGQWRKQAVTILRTQNRYPTITELVHFIEVAAQEATDPVFGSSTCMQTLDHSRTKSRKPKGTSFNVQTTDKINEDSSPSSKLENKPISTLSCHYCSGCHALVKCDTFRQLTPDKRLEVVKGKKLCLNCFSARHWSNKCDKDSRCTVKGCSKKHSHLLHIFTPPVNKSEQSNHPEAQSSHIRLQGATFQATGTGAVKVALPIVHVKVKDVNNRYVDTYALLDSGSTNSFCSLDLYQQLGFKGEKTTLTLTTLEKHDSCTEVIMTPLYLTDHSGRQTLSIPRVFAVSKFPVFQDNIVDPTALERWPHLSGISFHGNSKSKVDLIIGQDVPEALVPIDIRRGKLEEPYAIKTLFGWSLNGPISTTGEFCAMSAFVQTDEYLTQQVEQFWKIHSCHTKPESHQEMSINDRRVMELWDDTTRLIDGHYVMKIPFRAKQPNFPNNYCIAESRLETLGRKLSRDPEKLKKYKSEIDGLVSKGYAERVIDEELRSDKNWYLPHHGVTNVNKPGKLRVVFDCASSYRDISLNVEVLQGPDLTNRLLGVLLRFREDRVAVMADIEAMFHQVVVHPDDRDVLRFLWWKNGDPTQQIEVFRMTVHLFGGVWSPSCANYALQRTANDNKDMYSPEVVKTVLDNFYVDDCLKSLTTPRQAINLFQDLCSLLAKGGFKLNKWVSNDREVIEAIPSEQRAQGVKDLDLEKNSLPVERALGVKWNTGTDQFGYKILPKERPFTRRGLLSIMSSVYDPLGFVSPYILLAKKIFQNETKRKKSWDSPLEDSNKQSWQKWLSNLHKIEQFWVPRCFLPENFGELKSAQLHHFSDASCEAYGVTSYIRLVNEDNKVHCTLVMAKSRLAPTKTLTIPRLELTAAVLATKVDVVLREELKTKIDQSVFWTDSEIVLRYVNNKDKRFQTFVANRIAQIHTASSPEQWRYISSSQNPADDVSRGLGADELLVTTRWQNGPDFLWKDSSHWPLQPEIGGTLPDDDKEIKKEVKLYHVATQEKCDPVMKLLGAFSSWYKLKKSFAWILRLKSNLLRKIRKEDAMPKMELTVSEIVSAEEEIVRLIQKQAFAGELNDLQLGSSVERSSKLYKLEPYVNSKGILCVGGRLRSAPISSDLKHQMILPKSHPVGYLIIRYNHEISAHSGKEYVLSRLRERFWIVGARRQVARVLRDCVSCKKRHAKPDMQRMADLPSDRVTPGKPPFTYVGVDCFGPFFVKRGRSQVKRYGCIFTCLSMRAIHIEMLSSMSTDSFINALKRFESRRGKPEKIRSDNGTNFTSAEKELNQSIREWNQTAISEHLRQQEIQWVFNPPSASHMGESWERQIRTVRKVLNALLTKNQQSLCDDSLNTLFCEVEFIVNNRPITAVSDDARDLAPLTPNNLLLLRSVQNYSPGNISIQDTYRKQWKNVQFLVNLFWKRWLREYLPTIQLRQKWFVTKRNFREGDVVLIVDDNSPRGSWPLGRVVKAHPGKDRLVRSVDVKTRGSVLTRPVNKLCLLESVPD